MTNDSFDPENKIQNKCNVSTNPDMSPGNDCDTTVTQNSEPVRSKRNKYKEKKPTSSEDKETYLFKVTVWTSMLKGGNNPKM